MKANNTPTNVANLLSAAAYVHTETIINGDQAAQLDAMVKQINDLAAKIEAVPAKIAGLAAQGKKKAVAMWERMAARYKAQFADAVANLRDWLVDFKTNRPNVQINLDGPEEPETPNPDNTPNVSALARWIDLQLSTIIEGVSAGYSLGNCNSVWIDKGATVFNVSLANGETVEVDSDNYNTAEDIAIAILSALNETTPPTKNRTTMKTTTAAILDELNARKCRGAWDKAVNAYAVELVESLDNWDKQPENVAELREMLLNGADDWKAYSWGGSSLIYNQGIAERLCSPSELKRVTNKNGLREFPNRREHWLDVQARALYQAANRVECIAAKYFAQH